MSHPLVTELPDGWDAVKADQRRRVVYWRRRFTSGAFLSVKKADDGRWRWALRGPDRDPSGGYAVHAEGTRSTRQLAQRAADRFMNARPCGSCGGPCEWSVDAWICSRCGDEWYPDHGFPFTDPDDHEAAR